MNIRLILTLSLLGLLVAFGSIAGLIPAGWETAVWAVIVLVCANVLARRAPGKFFLHGFLTGFIAGAVSLLCHALFMTQYLAHNAKADAGFKALPAGMSPALVVVLLSPFFGGLLGVVTGLLTWGWARFTRPKPAVA